MSETDETKLSLDVIYNQHWEHARHVESERFWFTNIFVIIVGAAFAYAANEASNQSSNSNEGLSTDVLGIIPLGVFFLSLIGYGLLITWRAAFVEHISIAIKMVEQNYPNRGLTPYRNPHYKLIKDRRINAHNLFLWFYGVIASLAILFLWIIWAGDWIWWGLVPMYFSLNIFSSAIPFKLYCKELKYLDRIEGTADGSVSAKYKKVEKWDNMHFYILGIVFPIHLFARIFSHNTKAVSVESMRNDQNTKD